VAELPRLDYLVRLTDTATDNTHWILQGNLWHRCIEQPLNKLKCLLLFNQLALKPPCSTDCQMRAWRVSNHYVPTLVQVFKYILLDMLPWYLSGQ
jgi:hypothetical protein